jgi:hypothetical protein
VLGHTPALWALLQGEAPSAAAMVLLVSGISLPWAAPPGGPSSTAAQQGKQPALELSDGWYCVRAHVDELLAELIAQGRMQVGGSGCVGVGVQVSAAEITEQGRMQVGGAGCVGVGVWVGCVYVRVCWLSSLRCAGGWGWLGG